VSPSGALDAFVWRTPDERLVLPAEPAVAEPAPVVEAIAAPPPAATPAPAPQAVELDHRAAPAQSPAVVPAARTGVIIDPASMAPDDPGPEEPEAKRRGFRLYAND
jgi:HemY protein